MSKNAQTILSFFTFLITVASIISPSYSHEISLCKGMVPENHFNIPSWIKTSSTVTQDDFMDVLNRITKIYAPVIKQKGGRLVVKHDWENGTVNAYASRNTKDHAWMVHMFGGLARFEGMTKEAFALVLCHELGHHLGGAPVKTDYLGFKRWSSVEGQADYFATLKCMKRYFDSENNERIASELRVSSLVWRECQSVYQTSKEVAKCVRVAHCGMQMAQVLATLSGQTDPDLSTPDPSEVDQTDELHPTAQCRLDTYFAGSLCRVDPTSNHSEEDYRVGTCYRLNPLDIGVRPLCWFHP